MDGDKTIEEMWAEIKRMSAELEAYQQKKLHNESVRDAVLKMQQHLQLMEENDEASRQKKNDGDQLVYKVPEEKQKERHDDNSLAQEHMDIESSDCESEKGDVLDVLTVVPMADSIPNETMVMEWRKEAAIYLDDAKQELLVQKASFLHDIADSTNNSVFNTTLVKRIWMIAWGTKLEDKFSLRGRV